MKMVVYQDGVKIAEITSNTHECIAIDYKQTVNNWMKFHDCNPVDFSKMTVEETCESGRVVVRWIDGVPNDAQFTMAVHFFP